MHKLFSYGTLQQPEVQQHTFGRTLAGKADVLPGYRVEQVEITDPEVLAISGKRFHPILRYTGCQTDQVKGMVFAINDEDIVKSDEYETDAYQRVAATMCSGDTAWIYIAAHP